MTRKVGLISLGCDKNTVDSEFILGILQKHNCDFTNDAKEAEIIIVNTCGFIEAAKQESIDTILEMAQYKVSGKCKFLIAAGCLSQRYKGQLLDEIPELDAVIGTGDFDKIWEVIDNLGAAQVDMTQNSSFLDFDLSNRLRIYPYFSFVKIAEGCDKACSYCAIPQIRGPYRSREVSSIKEEVRGLLARGVKEIVLVAQDTTNYGSDIFGKPALPRLLRELDLLEGDFLLRLLYTYPANIDDELLGTIASSTRIANYLDIPLQHANRRILNLMRRPAEDSFTNRLLDNIRKNYPEIALRTTFIVGFPTETEDEFNELLDFMRHYKFERVGAFEFSPEEGTRAATLKPQIAKSVKHRRIKELMELQKGISRINNERAMGSTVKVLAESYDPKKGIYIGRSEFDAPLVDGVIKFTGNADVGCFTDVKIIRALDYDLMGKVSER